jgi:hypothetical protein
MSQHADLLAQAVSLAKMDVKKPKQANSEIRELASAFVDLQDHRHLADYDLTERFKRSDVLLLIAQVWRHIESFKNLAPSNEKQFFLACLWAWKELANR